MKAAALRTAPPIIIAILAILFKDHFFSIRENLLVFEVLFHRDAGSHDGGEFGVVHHAAAGVGGEVFFHNLFRNPANGGGHAGKSCGVKDCFNKLVVRHGISRSLFFQLPEDSSFFSHSSRREYRSPIHSLRALKRVE